MDEDISGNYQPANAGAELLQTALSLAIHHPNASARWYATLSESDLQALSGAIGEMLVNINHLISTLRGHVADDAPEMKLALAKLQPLLDVSEKVKKAKGK